MAHRATNAIDTVTLADSDFHDLNVRVKVCVDNLLEKNCKAYTEANGTVHYKPIDRDRGGAFTASRCRLLSGLHRTIHPRPAQHFLRDTSSFAVRGADAKTLSFVKRRG